MFKIGDRVVLIKAHGVFTLEYNKSYDIAEINYSGKIRMVDDEEFYSEKRFTKDIRYLRRLKIKKMKWKEINY